MKSTSTLLATLVISIVVACILAPNSFACTPPPVEGIVKSWAPFARVLVTFNPNLNLTVGGAGCSAPR